MTEIKIRGPLTPNQAKSLQQFLSKNGLPVHSGREVALYLDTSMFPRVGDFTTGFSRISLKRDEKGMLLRIKEGNPSDTEREERTLRIHPKDLGNLFFLFEELGIQNGFYRPAYRKIYSWKGLRISLKTQCAIGDHFEVEARQAALLRAPFLHELLKKFELAVWNKENYQQQIADGMANFPAISLQEALLLDW